MEDNIARQAEEVEALSSIYGDQWSVEDERSQSYSIQISEQGQQVIIYITLPADYPSHSPPIYQLSAPSLNRHDKLELSGILENIYLDNIGENILFQWGEAAKEFLEKKTKLNCVEDACANKDDDGSGGNTVLSMEPCTEPCMVLEVPNITHGEIITDRKSCFQGHVAVINSVDQVKLILSVLMQNKKIAHATHNIYAYRVQKNGQPNVLAQDCEDDGETAAGSRLLHLLQIMDVMNILVVVSRWYGGVHLGPDRFRHINNAARQTLELAGLSNKKK